MGASRTRRTRLAKLYEDGHLQDAQDKARAEYGRRKQLGVAIYLGPRTGE